MKDYQEIVAEFSFIFTIIRKPDNNPIIAQVIQFNLVFLPLLFLPNHL